MRYYIEINGIESVMCETKDLAVFIARKLKEQRPHNEIVVYKEGEFVYMA